MKANSQSGFTLVELMVALAIAGIVFASIFASYFTSQKSQNIQDQVAEMQQNIRAAMLMMTRDVREAGCDPRMEAGAGISVAARGQIRITRDIAGHPVNPNNQDDGDTSDANEDIIFGFDPTVDTNAQPDGIPDTAVVANLCRNDVNGLNVFQPIAENIERIEFNYIDEDGASIAAPVLFQSDRNRIRAVQISLLVRSSRQDEKFLDTATYTTAAGNAWGPFNDGFRRRLSVTTIHCRNIGL